MIRLAIALALLSGCGGCGTWDLDLERMIDQPHYTSYERCDTCPTGSIMMMPPVGTKARSVEVGPVELVRGRKDGKYVTAIPIEVDRLTLMRGQNRFDTFCATCHGRLGNGLSRVAQQMRLRKPVDLLQQQYVNYPAGRVFTAITEGYGFMRSYAGELPLRDRWAVVAYVQALQLSQRVAIGDLPSEAQTEARRWLK
jgi:Cytochrome C oxidase, cbb3-type, subunit III